MKSPLRVRVDVERRLSRTWADAVAGDKTGDTWPHLFPLGQPTSAELAAGFAAIATAAANWREWAKGNGVSLAVRARRVHGTEQELPTHLVVPDLDTAAALCGAVWQARIARGRERAQRLASRFPTLADRAPMVSAVDGLGDVDFELLCTAGEWFAAHDATGLTPRQVPIEGMHAKWLNTRKHLVRELAGVDDLGLLPPHPPRLHFTYLDPAYRAGGGRVHDSVTVGDSLALPYEPKVVVISENKDTAIHFPPTDGGVSVEGMGRGGGTAAAVQWLVDAPLVVYWGDMDADGLEILDEFRAAGVPAVSMLMDVDTYDTWRRFGVDTDAQGRLISPPRPRPVPHLRGGELALYERLTSPGWDGPRRIEQERIPLHVAARALESRSQPQQHRTGRLAIAMAEPGS